SEGESPSPAQITFVTMMSVSVTIRYSTLLSPSFFRQMILPFLMCCAVTQFWYSGTEALAQILLSSICLISTFVDWPPWLTSHLTKFSVDHCQFLISILS